MNTAGVTQGDPPMRFGIVVAAAALTLSATGAQAEEWCGYTTQPNAVIECGYTTASDCTTAVGKGGMCFVDPELARYFRPIEPATRVLATRLAQRHG
jgi:hypothetical protein